MKYADINRKYTDIVADYIGKGYKINTATMRDDSAGVGRIDLTNGAEIIRVMVTTFPGVNNIHDSIEIAVGRVWNDAVKPDSDDCYHTIDRSDIEILSAERFYLLGGDDYGTQADANAFVAPPASKQFANRAEFGADYLRYKVYRHPSFAHSMTLIFSDQREDDVAYSEYLKNSGYDLGNLIVGESGNPLTEPSVQWPSNNAAATPAPAKPSKYPISNIVKQTPMTIDEAIELAEKYLQGNIYIHMGDKREVHTREEVKDGETRIYIRIYCYNLPRRYKGMYKCGYVNQTTGMYVVTKYDYLDLTTGERPE